MRYFVDGKRATLHDAQRALRVKYAQNVADVLAIMRKGGEISPPS